MRGVCSGATVLGSGEQETKPRHGGGGGGLQSSPRADRPRGGFCDPDRSEQGRPGAAPPAMCVWHALGGCRAATARLQSGGQGCASLLRHAQATRSGDRRPGKRVTGSTGGALRWWGAQASTSTVVSARRSQPGKGSRFGIGRLGAGGPRSRPSCRDLALGD